MQLDDIQRCHRETGAIDEAANVAVEANVVQTGVGGNDL